MFYSSVLNEIDTENIDDAVHKKDLEQIPIRTSEPNTWPSFGLLLNTNNFRNMVIGRDAPRRRGDQAREINAAWFENLKPGLEKLCLETNLNLFGFGRRIYVGNLAPSYQIENPSTTNMADLLTELPLLCKVFENTDIVSDESVCMQDMDKCLVDAIGKSELMHLLAHHDVQYHKWLMKRRFFSFACRRRRPKGR